MFVGEYASKGNTYWNALTEASYLTGIERNSDVVELASYAPLLSNVGYVNWTARRTPATSTGGTSAAGTTPSRPSRRRRTAPSRPGCAIAPGGSCLAGAGVDTPAPLHPCPIIEAGARLFSG
ncbi:alpha-L-arabinofuranosidase C-terminal domain-containing protein [Microbispora bryophytorum]|uniref:alpha-L-arabinofuranosidase C-terminal domain-containing protein n=1 Tax=Microbispora bryophytorum TaxID=1460882 RepID=UPI0033DCF12C